MGAIEDQRRYGWCVRTGAWVPRDAMLGAHVKLFGADGREEHVTVRLHPEAHAQFAEEIRALSWQPHRELHTRADLVAAGERVLDLEIGSTDTAAWYEAQRARVEDDALVAQALLRPLLRAQDLTDLMGRALAAVATSGRSPLAAEAWVAAVRALRGKLPRWDGGVLDFGAWPVTAEGWEGREEYPISADEAEVAVLVVQGDTVRVERIEHDAGERAMRALGKLTAEPQAITR